MGKKISQEEIILALIDISFFKSTGATSLSDIAERLGIKKASLYNHFDSRDAILSEAFKFCADYLSEINFLPPDLEAVTKKYSAASVLKGIINRYFKMHEKRPLFQIYTFVESQKYFSKPAAEIVSAEQARLYEQTEILFKSLMNNGKIFLPEAYKSGCIQWFLNGVSTLLSNRLMQRKRMIVENPSGEEGELFPLPVDDSVLEEIDRLIDDFTRRIG